MTSFLTLKRGEERAKKEKMKFHKLLMAAGNYCYYYFVQRLRWQYVCNALRDTEDLEFGGRIPLENSPRSI